MLHTCEHLVSNINFPHISVAQKKETNTVTTTQEPSSLLYNKAPQTFLLSVSCWLWKVLQKRWLSRRKLQREVQFLKKETANRVQFMQLSTRKYYNLWSFSTRKKNPNIESFFVCVSLCYLHIHPHLVCTQYWCQAPRLNNKLTTAWLFLLLFASIMLLAEI